MELVRKFRMRAAAKRYASRLERSLQRSFGPGLTYTPQQIQRGVSDCALDPKYIVFAYAAFLPKAEFDARVSELPIVMSYDEARALYLRFVRAKATPAGGGTQGVGEPSMPGGNGD